MNKKTSLKVLCLGNSQTGKTSFINRLVFNTFSDNVVSTIIGKNTEYIINPEEILADNFAYLVTQKKNLPNPEIIQKIAAILK